MVTDRAGPTITTLKAEVDYLDGEVKKLLNLLADERTESMKLRTRVTELEGQHKGLVLNNAILRERPDLPLNRIPAARAMTKLYEDNERLRAALERMLLEFDFMVESGVISDVRNDIIFVEARAALEGRA